MEGGDRVDADGIPLDYSTHWQKRSLCALRTRITFRFGAFIAGNRLVGPASGSNTENAAFCH